MGIMTKATRKRQHERRAQQPKYIRKNGIAPSCWKSFLGIVLDKKVASGAFRGKPFSTDQVPAMRFGKPVRRMTAKNAFLAA
jgi:hypothetical protein